MVFGNVSGASISIKLLPDRYLSHQQAYLQLTNWVNESCAVQNITILYFKITYKYLVIKKKETQRLALYQGSPEEKI